MTKKRMRGRDDGFDTWRCVLDALAALDRALDGA
jgi:hypothetical protein